MVSGSRAPADNHDLSVETGSTLLDVSKLKRLMMLVSVDTTSYIITDIFVGGDFEFETCFINDFKLSPVISKFS